MSVFLTVFEFAKYIKYILNHNQTSVSFDWILYILNRYDNSRHYSTLKYILKNKYLSIGDTDLYIDI